MSDRVCAESATRKALLSRRPSRASYQLTNRLTPSVTPITAQLRSEISGGRSRPPRPSAYVTRSHASDKSARPMTAVAAVSNLRWP